MKRFYPESDGGGWYEGDRHIIQPKTYYVADRDGGEPAECASWAEAKALALKMNQEVEYDRNGTDRP